MAKKRKTCADESRYGKRDHAFSVAWIGFFVAESDIDNAITEDNAIVLSL